ncbi:ELWxxDGT repeat protein [Soonwooa sp.]|uniref:ELWxxDGT repeat protein n=1 Tax=Soonwooa sp. TaxID=1938592 RepID=UPI00261B5CE9|nr:ELWxxDGT repeat protein [Soonwooa sp.]
MKKVYLSLLMLTAALYQSQSVELVKDIRPGSGSGSPANFVQYNNKLYFSANDGTTGVELWESDGTNAGTKLVQDYNTGSGNFNPTNFCVKQGELFFAGGIGSMPNGIELYKYNPTEGIKLFADIKPGSAGSSPSQLQVNADGSLLYFRASDAVDTAARIYKTDGVNAPTPLSSTFISYTAMMALDNTIIAAGGTDLSDVEIYKSTGAEFSLIKDIRPSASSTPNNFYYSPTLKKMFFTARTDQNGTEPWITDGTTEGTTLLKDINKVGSDQGTTNSGVTQMIEYKGKIYFAANDGVNGSEVWVSDGTEAGTKMLKDLIPGSASSNPSTFTIHNDLLFFVANDAALGRELFVTDGTEAGTKLYLDIVPGATGSSISDIISYNNKLYIVGMVETAVGKELYEVKMSNLGTSVSSSSTLKVFPNPSNGDFKITTKEFQNFKIYDLSGKLVKSGAINNQEIKSGLKAGQYVLVLEAGNKSQSTSIIIK